MPEAKVKPRLPLTRLSVQLGTAFALLVLLFAGVALYALGMFERQIASDALVDLAARLELSAQQLHTQAMQYKENAPRDYPTYYRDLRLYYQDLMAHVATFDRVVSLFMMGDFRAELPHLPAWLQPKVGPEVDATIHGLEQTWASYREGLVAQLGDDQDEPRLEYASEHILDHSAGLEQATRSLTEGLMRWAASERQRVVLTFATAVGLAVLVAVVLMLLLYALALAPMRRTIQGFQRVADGDFGHRVPVEGSAEVRDLAESFNRLAERLDLLFQLIDRLQRGGDLNEVVGFIAREFGGLLRLDWIGVVLVGPDALSARLEAGHLDGTALPPGGPPFRLAGTLVELALREGRPVRVADLPGSAEAGGRPNPLAGLAGLGMRDAVVLPLTGQTHTQIPAAVIFAARRADRYDPAHLRFLGNIAHLVAHSFGRTLRLAEQGRLAAIGEFATGIAHELRTPLATVSLALDGLQVAGLQDRSQRRLDLARQEATRMARLLEDILLYAKPLVLNPRPTDPGEALRSFIEGHADIAQSRGQRLLLTGPGPRDRGPSPRILADPDRLAQILTNLTRNACEAAPDGAVIRWEVLDDPAAGLVRLCVSNPGPTIPEPLLARVMEPFVTSKAKGTGLGLAIVNRLVQAHGGELEIRSTEGLGTRVEVSLPIVAAEDMGPSPEAQVSGRPDAA